MTDDVDRAQAHETELLADALRDHHRRAGLAGKTAADSAAVCQASGCGETIPETRRQAAPGCRFCVACQTRQERKTRQ
ncbi:TraR/DksA C4-type zinc finger protein [Acidovorax sp. SUPP3334]|uniref:TraR/DksA C4-type zinc finger protein n=1 Tax=Acidovorax sp. SUPP3334 TaxID=2920881 RepID=UPI0023DE32CB|nr:TraR/DksA C4-type zinc finger protein [Acidovorax sp. SUPP3334]GKT21676.1 TraR/DksA C4-type zinc finger protein [Acidovorax sp. SUPP3334]